MSGVSNTMWDPLSSGSGFIIINFFISYTICGNNEIFHALINKSHDTLCFGQAALPTSVLDTAGPALLDDPFGPFLPLHRIMSCVLLGACGGGDGGKADAIVET